MTEPIQPKPEARARDVTGVIRSAPPQNLPSDSFDYDFPEQSQVPSPAARAAMEPLFNKKAMVAWAVLAFAAWMAVTVVIPAAARSAKTAIRQAVREAEVPQPDGSRRKVIILPNGKRITITTDGPSVDATTPVAGSPAAPAAPAAAAPKAVPAPEAAPQPQAPAARKR